MRRLVKVILATGDEVLDRYIRGLPWVEVVGEARYKEAVPDAVRPGKGEVLLLSAYLPGSMDIIEVVYAARTAGTRVLFLAGDMREESFVADLVALGVYDILFNPIAIEEIEERLKTPATFGEAAKLLSVSKMPEGKRLLPLLKRFWKKEEQEEKRSKIKPIERGDVLEEKLLKETEAPGPGSGKAVGANETPVTSPAVSSRAGTRGQRQAGRPAVSLFALGKLLKPEARKEKPRLSETDAQNARRKHGASEPGLVVRRRSLAVRVWLIIGAAPRVGTTSFALALARYAMEKGETVRVTGGGGADEWLGENAGDVFLPASPRLAAAPGEITIVDAREVPDDLALVSAAVWVTDLSPGSLNVAPLVPGRTYVVGTRGVQLAQLEELAAIKDVIPLCTLAESPAVRDAQAKGILPLPPEWVEDVEFCFNVLSGIF